MNNIPNLALNNDDPNFDRVGNYKFSRKSIGRGNSALIYKGYGINTKVPVAIKEIRDQDSKKYQELIKGEIQIMKKLKHPNIVELYDVVQGDDHKSIYVILELSTIGDFHKWLGGKCLKEPHCKNYMKQLVSGLRYLHEKGITHRDLKPQNILMFGNGKQIKITDFGFAKYTSEDALSQTFCGTPLYMAPELWLGEPYDDKTDLWSVGAIMYEMLTGRVPFNVKNYHELKKKVLRGGIVFPKRITEKCLDLLKSLLEINPEKRISWEGFFNHPWLVVDDLMVQENNLLNFSISNSMSLSSLPVKNSILGSIFDQREDLESSFQNFSFHLSESQTNIACSPPRAGLVLPPVPEHNEEHLNEENENGDNSDDEFFSADDSHPIFDHAKKQKVHREEIVRVSIKKDMASQTETDNSFSLDIRDIFESNPSMRSHNPSDTYLVTSQNEDLSQSYFNVSQTSQTSQVSSSEIVIEETGDKFILINTAPINIHQSNPETQRHRKYKGIFDSVHSLARDSYDYISDHLKSI